MNLGKDFSPLANRNGSRSGPGFQRPSAAPLGALAFPVLPYLKPPGVVLPKAANDNLLYQAERSAGRALARSSWRYGFIRFLPRLIPWAGVALLAYYIWRAGQSARPAQLDTTGFYLYQHCRDGDPAVVFDVPLSCGFNGDYSNGFEERWLFGPDSTWLVPLTPTGVPSHYTPTDLYRKQGSGPNPDPVLIPAQPARSPQWWVPSVRPELWPEPQLPPEIWPALDPDLLPIAEPSAPPQPLPYPLIPYRVPNPWRVNQPETGNEVPDDPYAEPEPQPEPDRQVIVDPGGKTIEEGPRKRQRPRRREKERKTRSRALGQFLRVVGEVTEYKDYIEAIYDALPSKLKVRFKLPSGDYVQRKNGEWAVKYNPTPDEKAQAIYRAWDKMTPEQFEKFLPQMAKNLLTNEIEDRIIGRISQGASGINEHLGREFAIGVQTGHAL